MLWCTSEEICKSTLFKETLKTFVWKPLCTTLTFTYLKKYCSSSKPCLFLTAPHDFFIREYTWQDICSKINISLQWCSRGYFVQLWLWSIAYVFLDVLWSRTPRGRKSYLFMYLLLEVMWQYNATIRPGEVYNLPLLTK